MGERIQVEYDRELVVRRMHPEDFDRFATGPLRRVMALAATHPDLAFAVDTLHIIDVSGPPDKWRYIRLGRCDPEHVVNGERVVDISCPVMLEQALDSYSWAKLSGEPAFAVISHHALTYRRLIVPVAADRLVVASEKERPEPVGIAA